MSETKPTAADVLEFVGRGVRAQCVVDAAIAGSRCALVRARIEAALATDVDASPSQWLRSALAELAELELELARHFERFAR